MPYLTSEWGNPSSTYKFGAKLKAVIETARAQVGDLIGAHAMEIIFTSCATESNNAAIHAALKVNLRKRHIVTSVVEHSSVLNYCMALVGASMDGLVRELEDGASAAVLDILNPVSFFVRFLNNLSPHRPLIKFLC